MLKEHDNFRRQFGVVLRKVRSMEGLTQQDLEELSGIQRGFISDVECGRKSMSLFKLYQMCESLPNTTLSNFTQLLIERIQQHENTNRK